MKNLAILAVLLVLASNRFGFAQDAASKQCPNLKVVLQHKNLAVQLKLKISQNVIEGENGQKRCPTKGEMVDALAEKFPEYVVETYGELFE